MHGRTSTTAMFLEGSSMNRIGCGMTRVNIGERDNVVTPCRPIKPQAPDGVQVRGRSVSWISAIGPSAHRAAKVASRAAVAFSTKFSMREGGCMARKPKNHGESWTKADDRQLKTLVRQNTPTRLIASKLGRTKGAVYQHASSIGASLRPTNQSPNNRRKK